MRCNAGKCQEPTLCWSDSDCIGDRKCQKGECVDEIKGCRQLDCPPKHLCNAEDGVCEAYPCDNDSQCGGSRRCSEISHVCTECVEDADCGAGNTCHSYRCIPGTKDGCRHALDCKKGEACHTKHNRCIKLDTCVNDNMEPNDKPEQAKPLEPGEYQLHQCAEDQDWFTIDVQAGESLMISMTYPFEEGLPEVKIANPEGNEIQRAVDRFGEGYIALPVEEYKEDTKVLFTVKYKDGTGMPYTLEVMRGFQLFCTEDQWEPNDIMEEAVTRPPNIYYSMRICDGRDDWFQTDIDVGQEFIVNVETTNGQAPLVEIYEEGTAERVAFDFSEEKAKAVTYKTRKAGKHYVRLFPRYLDDTSSYGLRLKHAKYVR